MLEAKPISTPWSPGMQLHSKNGTPFRGPTLFWSIVGALQYLSITRPNLSFVMNSVSQYLHAHLDSYFKQLNVFFVMFGVQSSLAYLLHASILRMGLPKGFDSDIGHVKSINIKNIKQNHVLLIKLNLKFIYKSCTFFL